MYLSSEQLGPHPFLWSSVGRWLDTSRLFGVECIRMRGRDPTAKIGCPGLRLLAGDRGSLQWHIDDSRWENQGDSVEKFSAWCCRAVLSFERRPPGGLTASGMHVSRLSSALPGYPRAGLTDAQRAGGEGVDFMGTFSDGPRPEREDELGRPFWGVRGRPYYRWTA